MNTKRHKPRLYCKQTSPRDEILLATNRYPDQRKEWSAEQVMAADKALSEFRKMGREL